MTNGLAKARSVSEFPRYSPRTSLLRFALFEAVIPEEGKRGKRKIIYDVHSYLILWEILCYHGARGRELNKVPLLLGAF
jgi:hypothetical protein